MLTETRKEYSEPVEYPSVALVASPVRLDVTAVKKACKSLKNRKASGSIGIPAELLKHETEKLFQHLRDLFQNCLNGGDIPEDWKVTYIFTIQKKGDKNEYDNYRGISVTSTFSRLYGRILKEIIEKEYCDMEMEEQTGFRIEQSTVDNLFYATQ